MNSIFGSLQEQLSGEDWLVTRSPYGVIYVVNEPRAALRALQDEKLERTSLIRSVLGDGLLASDGEHWERMRRILLPQFGRDLPFQFAETAQALLRERFASGRIVDLSRELTMLTTDVVCRVLLGGAVGPSAEPLADSMLAFSKTLGSVAQTLFGAELVLTPEFSSQLRRINETLDRFVEQARRAGGPYLRAMREHDLTDKQIRDEIVTLLISGHETTALTVGWAIYLLCRHPEIGDRLASEVQTEDRKLTNKIIQETLRLYPPVWFIARRALEEVTLGDRAIPKDGVVVVIPYFLHRRKPEWTEPESFQPDRFEGKLGPYLPFGKGRHLCPGQRAGTLEATALLAELWKRYTVRLESFPAPQPWLTLRPDPSLRVTLQARPG